jgi:RNA recognition motif-containing protein
MSVYNDQAKIFIGHLPIDITESELEYHFRPYGYIKSLYIIKSYAFIEYGNNDSAKNAISDMNNSKLNGKKIIVQKALNEREKRERLNEKKNEYIINISNNSLSSSPLSKKKNEISNRINKKCSICDKIDHNTSECDYLKENKKIYDKNNSRDYFKECFKCGSINHLERDCPFINRKSYSRSRSRSKDNSYSKHSSYYKNKSYSRTYSNHSRSYSRSYGDDSNSSYSR